MSSSVSFDFIENYLSWIRSKSSQKTIGDFEEITTPFVDSHNDKIQFYVSRSPNGFSLTDDGYTLSDLARLSSSKSRNRWAFLSKTVKSPPKRPKPTLPASST